MNVIILLLIDFGLLGIVFFFYIRRMLRERAALTGAAEQSIELQQKVYQIQVLQEIGERIGYTLDSSKIIEIVTGSIGPLLEYETVSFMLYGPSDQIVFKCHVHQSVNHHFIDQVKEKMQAATGAMCGRLVDFSKIDQRMEGVILDDSLDTQLRSYVNIPVIIGSELLGLINISSAKPGLYGYEQAAVLYTITNQASIAVTQLQNVLENEKGKLLGIISAMTDGVLMVDLNNQLVVSNPATVDILQLPVGRPITMFDILDALAGKIDLRTQIDKALAKNMPVTMPEVYLKDKAIEITISIVRDQNGEHRGAAVILHDVTSEKSLEKLRQEFTAMMVHELRAPLTAVRWSSESLLKGLADAKAQTDPVKIKDAIGTIDIAASNMLELVNDLLDVAKIESGKFDLNIQDYDLPEVVKDQVKAFTPQAESKHITVNVTAPETLKIKFDRVRISQVLNNLLSNAIKYSDSGQIDVNIEMKTDEHIAVVSIKDSGIGVSHEDLGSLFSKFKQLKSADSSRKGTGLGLVVSKGIVEAHGGRIWAESPGENLGTTFLFSLPIKA